VALPEPDLYFGFASDDAFHLARKPDFTSRVIGKSRFDFRGYVWDGGEQKGTDEYVRSRHIEDSPRVARYVQDSGAVGSQLRSATKCGS
jgi:hypothetical protein